MFLGVPGDVGPWGSAWVATSWFDETSPSPPVMLQSSMWAADSADQAVRCGFSLLGAEALVGEPPDVVLLLV